MQGWLFTFLLVTAHLVVASCVADVYRESDSGAAGDGSASAPGNKDGAAADGGAARRDANAGAAKEGGRDAGTNDGESGNPVGDAGRADVGGGASGDGGASAVCNPACAPGQHCELVQVQCFAPPCPPLPQCADNPSCGGIAGVACPGLGRCQDDPNDSCDPQNGGADCGGVCVCDAKAKCLAGQLFDSSPGVCNCVGDACAAVSCKAGTECVIVNGQAECRTIDAGGGETCGNVVCPAGMTCCNPLLSICTAPGGICAF